MVRLRIILPALLAAIQTAARAALAGTLPTWQDLIVSALPAALAEALTLRPSEENPVSETTDRLLSVGEAAERIGCQSWRLAYAYRKGLLPEPPRAGRHRLVREADLPTIAAVLRRAGLLH